MARWPTRRPVTALVAAVAAAGVLAGCTGGPGPFPSATPTPTPTPEPLPAVARELGRPATVVPDAADDVVALAASTHLYERAPVVVLAPTGVVAAQLAGASAAVALGVPLLLTGGTADVAAELDRLETDAVLTVADAEVPPGSDVDVVPAPDDEDDRAIVLGNDLGEPTPVPAGGEVAAVVALDATAPVWLTGAAPAPTSEPTASPSGTASPSDDGSTSPEPSASDDAQVLPPVERPGPPSGAAVLATGDPRQLAAIATARAAGLPVHVVTTGDPRALAADVDALADLEPTEVLGLGTAFLTPDLLATRVATASTGVQLPGGGQLVFPVVPGHPGKRYVALYGTPGDSRLGVLGEQDVAATVTRAQATAGLYTPLTPDTVVPTLEIIATIASAGPEGGDYSRERTVAELRPLVEAAGAAGQYVVLDLQPGRTDFVTQAKLYEELLAMPHVGLALDPEWRLAPDQVHLRQIGSVGIDEVNAVVTWLADLARDRHLPQKMLVLHQFALRMIAERERLDTTRDELAVVIHVDGQGSQPAKAGTWRALQQGAPAGVHWGWKNFYDEDVPVLDPAQTYRVRPVPDLVSYQ